jgi:hypothetical protein
MEELNRPFKSQTELVEYVQKLAKDTVTVFKTMGFPASTLMERWEELVETEVEEMIGEERHSYEAHLETLGNEVDEARGLATDVACEIERLDDAVTRAMRTFEKLRRRK